MKKVELLAPAGSYEAFLGAIHAGADAVYLGGQRFGARAYAENFTDEEVCLAIRYAHLYHRKVYMTLNTLMKEYEMAEVYDYMKPFYEAGLDGVIVQDIGLFSYIKEHFPGLELHVSTQMTITGVYGARLLKELGAKRIVPARELSLAEIKEIKSQVDIEIETFIHGAMCYCYSGQCLFSSLLGGRSGNRGRCAQPCRLPYQAVIDEVQEAPKAVTGSAPVKRNKTEHMTGKPERTGKSFTVQTEQYPLSLKDMCTIEMLPRLIEAGIDSFKIEGRMKKPEYAAGVTALYRKYIDRYYANPKVKFAIEDKDYAQLKTLYMRSDLQDGYYDRHNGAEMITPHKPSYVGCDDALLASIRETYIDNKLSIQIQGAVTLKEGSPLCISVRYGETEVTVYGQTVEQAKKQPLDKESVEKQMRKTGSTAFTFAELDIRMDNNVFLPLKAINELRREALAQLEDAIIAENAKMSRDSEDCYEAETETAQSIEKECQIEETQETEAGQSRGEYTEFASDREKSSYKTEQQHIRSEQRTLLTAEVTNLSQLKAVCESGAVQRVYVSSDLLMEPEADEVLNLYDRQSRVYANGNNACEDTKVPSLFIALPHILRRRSQSYLERLKEKLQAYPVEGVMVRNLEGYEWLREIGWKKEIIADANLYAWNNESKGFFAGRGIGMTAPLELNGKELRRLGMQGMEVIVYGRIPMMITANCVRKTNGKCILEERSAKGGRADSIKAENPKYSTVLTDRYNKKFDVITYCRHCYNIIYNSVPLSLHQFMNTIAKENPMSMRLSFTTESDRETSEVIRYFAARLDGADEQPPYADYTNGHYKRGAE